MMHRNIEQTLFNRLMSRGRLRHLQLILAVHKHMTLVGAAEALGISQPAASQLLNDAEFFFGIKIFDRHVRGCTPTAAGTELITVCRFILNTIQSAVERLQSHNSVHPHVIRIGCITSSSTGSVITCLTRLLRSIHDRNILVTEQSQERLLADLAAGRLDAVFGRRPAPFSEFSYVEIESDYPLVICSHTHPLAQTSIKDIDQLKIYPWIVSTTDDSIETYTKALFKEIGIPRTAIRMQTNSLFAILSLLKSTNWLCIVPSSIAPLIDDLASLCFLDIDLPASQDAALDGLGIITRDHSIKGLMNTLLEEPPLATNHMGPAQGFY